MQSDEELTLKEISSVALVYNLSYITGEKLLEVLVL